MVDSKAMLPKLSHNWADAKKFNAQRIRRRLKEGSECLYSKEENEVENLQSALLEQTGSGPIVTHPALAVSVTMSEDEESHGQIVNERSFSDNETTNVSAWAMMEHYEWSRDSASKRSSNSNRESETLSSQITEIEEDTRARRSASSSEQLLANTMIEWQENDNGELIEPLIHDDSSSTQSDAIIQTQTTSSSSRRITPLEGILLSDSHINERHEAYQFSFKAEAPQTTPVRVRAEWDPQYRKPTLVVQTSSMQDDGSTHSNVHQERVSRYDESSMSMNDGMFSNSSFQSSRTAAEDETVARQTKNVESHRVYYVSKIEQLENDLRNQKISTAEVQTKLKERVLELEQALRVTAATPKGTVVQENPLKTLLDRNQTLVKEVRFADQTCVELSSRITSLEQENKTLLERVETLEQENASLRLRHQHADDNLANINNQNIKTTEPTNAVSVSSERLPLETHRVLEENRLLGQQLHELQKLLETKNQELAEALERSSASDEEAKKEKHSVKLERDPGGTDDDASKFHLFSLQEQLQRERAIVASLKEKLDSVKTVKRHSSLLLEGKVDFESLHMVSNALSEMHQRYKNLEDRVVSTLDVYICRLEDLGKNVELLKSSIMFEEELQAANVKTRHHTGKGVETYASTPSANEGDVLELMEEARIPAESHIEFNDDDSSINFEDISHFVIDDDTLGSTSKNRSMLTDEGHIRWKENLESVLNECNRVKKRSTELRDEMARQKSIIEELEAENGKLSLQSSRKAEEIQMVETALLEAREVIVELEGKLLEANKRSDDAIQTLREKDEKIASLRKSIQRVESNCTMEHTKQQILEKRVSELELSLTEKTKSLEETTQLSSKYKVDKELLSTELRKTQEAVREKVEQAVSDLEHSLQKANDCIQDLKTKRQEAIDELSRAVELNTTQKKRIEELESQKEKDASKIEDSMLESQCSLEAMRRERAELRSKLSKRDAELASLKEMHASYKETSQFQLDQRLKQLQSFQAERADVLFHCENMYVMRQDFLALIQSIDNCEKFVNDIAAKQITGYEDRKCQCLEQETSCWKEILQYTGGILRTIPRRDKDAFEAVEKIGVLSSDLAASKSSEQKCKKILEEERKQNEKLCSLLGQAEFEMERSAQQIQEMSAALSSLQKKEANLNEKIRAQDAENSSYSEQLISLQKQFSEERKELLQKKIEMDEKLGEQGFQLVETTMELSAAKTELEKMADHLQSQATMLASREEKLIASESKCSRLREYIQKLTKKCEEWEKSYDHQLQCIEKLRRKNVKVLDKASEIARKYHKLKADVQRKQTSHNSNRKKWNHERSNIQSVHMQLEEELDLIAKELNAS